MTDLQTRSPLLISDDERAMWERDGYLLLKKVLDFDHVARLLEQSNSLVDAFDQLPPQQRTAHLGATGNRDDLRVKNVASLSGCLDDLLDHEPVFRRALALMGPYIQVCGTEILVRRPRISPALALHLDGGASLNRMMPHPGSPLSHLKALYFLTDITMPDTGNVIVVPGSHRIPLPDTVEEIARHPARDQERQLIVQAGDVLLFPWNLWHAVGANRADRTRISAVVWYSQLWARPVDYDRMDETVFARLTPRRRLLLGGLTDPKPSTYYLPASEDYLPTMLAGQPLDARELAPYVDDRLAHDWRDGKPA